MLVFVLLSLCVGIDTSLFKTTGGNEYNQDMRQFATTLKFYSSKAYDFVKTILPNKPRN